MSHWLSNLVFLNSPHFNEAKGFVCHSYKLIVNESAVFVAFVFFVLPVEILLWSTDDLHVFVGDTQSTILGSGDFEQIQVGDRKPKT